ncbi:MAG: hypothetical protein ACLGI9_18555 [Thermoanaerobaculia bacterium]
MTRKNLFAGAALLALFFSASHAGAYMYVACGGTKVVWNHDLVFVQNLYSIEPLSLREAALENAIDRWQNVRGMQNFISKHPVLGLGSTIYHGDGRNDAAVVKRSSIDGANGLTVIFHDGCFFGGDMEWTETDVMAAGDLGFGQLGETSLVTSGRSTFMHEVGHAIGLRHAQSFSNMRVPQPRPLVGGPGETIDALPDDAQGGRFLYPLNQAEVNVFTSAHRKTSGDSIAVNTGGTFNRCSSGGQTLTVNATAGNNGTVDVTQTERWWVSKSKTAHGGGIEVHKLTSVSFPANKVKTKSVTITLPPLEPGTYFLYHGVDLVEGVNESRADDNSNREALVIKVVDC